MLTEILVAVLVLIGAALYFVVKQNKRETIDLRNKHVLVTGGSSGIGFDLCVEAFKQGASVSVIARNKSKLDEIRVELEKIKKSDHQLRAKQTIQIESCDIANDYKATSQAIEACVGLAGPVDVLVNCAGVFKSEEFAESDPQECARMMNVNYLGAVYCTRAVIQSMKQRRFGRIVFISSQAGQIGIFGYTGYSASKFALRGFVECLQMEVKPFNIQLTTSFPPDTDTPGLAKENEDKPEETKQMADASGIETPKNVAFSIIKAVKKGQFTSHYGINGFLLDVLTCGAGPCYTMKQALSEIFALPLARLIAIFIGFNFDRIVKNCHKKKHPSTS